MKIEINILLGFLFFALAFQTNIWASSEIDDLVGGMLARYEAIKTGKFHFTMTRKSTKAPAGANAPTAVAIVKDENGNEYKKLIYGKSQKDSKKNVSENKKSNQPPNKSIDNPVPKSYTTLTKEMILTISGTEWVRRWPNYPNAEIYRSNYDVTYTENINPDKTTARSLFLKPPSGALDQGFWNNPWRRILNCGTIPFPGMYEFIKNNQDRAVLVKKDLNDIQIIEWELDQKEFDSVFHFYLAYLYEGRKAKLRIYVNKKLGFTIPKVEFVSKSGVVKFWCEANDFRKVSNGIYFPYEWKMINESSNVFTLLQFDFLEIKGINEPVDEKEFELAISKGTRIRNSIPGQESVFYVGETVKTSQIDSALQEFQKDRGITPIKDKWSFTRNMLILANILIISICILWFVVKKYQKKAK